MAPSPVDTTSPRRTHRRALSHLATAIHAALAAGAVWAPSNAYAARTCEEWSAAVTVVEGRIDVRRTDDGEWTSLSTGERVCSGATLRSHGSSRAMITLLDGTALRLDENSVLGLPDPPSGEGSLIQLLRGVIHVISRDPRALLFTTPYANAGLEGTEFDIHVDADERLTEVVVLEGAVAVSSPAGRLSVASDHVAIARDGQAPFAVPYDEPIERMRWASYFPPLIAAPSPAPDDEPLASQRDDAEFFARRAAARLGTARISAAEDDIANALRIAARNATALSVSALLALARADRDAAQRLIAEALDAQPSSVPARLVSSHLEESSARLENAYRVLREAAALEPDNAIVLTRLAEIALATGDTRAAIAQATRARRLAPASGAPLVVLGFARLRAFDTRDAVEAFDAAVALEPDAPMPRLGAGLAAIQSGDLVKGREQVELAVVLDPANPLTRSYMAKIYDAENRRKLTASQLDLARDFDPVDPTPWLYSSLHKLRTNRPIEALQDLQAATQLNADRPIFRSRLALDEDIATSSAGIGRVHSELGFGRLALSGAARALSDDPTNFAAHRLLADAYTAEPKHEIARASELYVSQLLQPANVAPIKPQLGQQNLFIAQRAGPGHASLDELSSPVTAGGLKLRASAVAGSNGIVGDDVAVAGLHDRLSYSVGHYRFETDGFRMNNDLEQSSANAFVQYRQSADTTWQAELRSARMAHGDLATFFESGMYSPTRRLIEDADSLRLGSKHQLAPNHLLLGSLVIQDVASTATASDSGALRFDTRQRAYRAEAQSISRFGTATLETGLVLAEQEELTDGSFVPALPMLPPMFAHKDSTNQQRSLYAYAIFNPAPTLTLTVGGSLDSIELDPIERDAFNPKLGVAWRPTSRTTVRTAIFQTSQNDLTTSTLNAQPRLEPVQIAGFTQLVFAARGDEATVRGISVDHELSATLFVGWQATTRRADSAAVAPFVDTIELIALRERAQEGYAYWMPMDRLSIGARYEVSRYRGDRTDLLGYSHLASERLPVEIRYFSGNGWTFGARASHVEQTGLFLDLTQPPLAPGQFALRPDDDRFWVVDAFINYRLPNRRGLLSLNADNLLDELFQFQDIDPSNPSVFPERLVSLRFTLAFD